MGECYGHERTAMTISDRETPKLYLVGPIRSTLYDWHNLKIPAEHRNKIFWKLHFQKNVSLR